ncbi:MAG: hypothetical protein ABI835_04830 [Chloroflexota bacterium]
MLPSVPDFLRATVAQFRSPLRAFVVFGSLIPLVLVVFSVVHDGSNLPFIDQWGASYPIAVGTVNGDLALSQLTRFNNEHRIVFTNMITVISARFFHWNLHLELTVTLALGVGLLLLLIQLIRRDFGLILPVALIPVSVLLFSLRGRHNWMSSLQSSFLWVSFFYLLAILCLQRGRVGWRPLLLAAGFTLCATFSLGNGLLGWALLLIGLPLLGYRKPAYLIFWILAAVASIALFYSTPSTSGMPSFSLSTLAGALHYALLFLGGLFVPYIPNAPDLYRAALAATLVSIVLFAANFAYLWWSRRSWKILTPWLLIAGYSAGTALVSGLGRVSLFAQSPEQPLSERYIILAVFWWISLIVLGAATVYSDSQRHIQHLFYRLLSSANILCFVAAIPFVAYAICYHVINFNIVSPKLESCTAQIAVTRNTNVSCAPLFILPITPGLLVGIDEMARQRLAMFNEPIDLDLTTIPYTTIQAGAAAPSYHDIRLDGITLPGLSEHPTAIIEYTLHVPIGYSQARFSASLYVNPENVVIDSEGAEDGVIFSAVAIGEDGETLHSARVLFDPRTSAVAIPFSFDLGGSSGETIRLQLQTEARTTLDYDWAHWVEPTLHLAHDASG